MASISDRSRRCIDSVNPRLGRVIEQALLAAPAWLDFGVISGNRTTEEQQELFAKGRDSEGNIVDKDAVVTYCDGVVKKSNHQGGKAVDIVAYVDGKLSWDEREIEKRAAYIVGFAASKGVELSGGVKWGWDAGHIEEA